MVAAPGRTDLASIQAATNAIITALSGGTTGDVLNGVAAALSYAKPPGYQYDRVSFTGNVAVSATTEATANTVVTGSAVTYDGATEVEIEFFAPVGVVNANAGGNFMIFALYDGAASIGLMGDIGTATANTSTEGPVRLSRILTPSAAAHTYSVRAYRTNANCQVTVGAGGIGVYMPGFIRIRKT